MARIISRESARNLRLPRYFTGKACRNGHVGERYVKSAVCVACDRERFLRKKQASDPTFASLKKREKNLRDRYGIEIADYMKLVESQGGRCAACHNLSKNLVVDHCHERDRVRGLLCNSCNAVIGFANDNPDILQLAIDYLVKHI